MFYPKPKFQLFCVAWLLVLSLAGNCVFAQLSTTLQFESFTINDGLSQGFISGIVQDKKGFMWFATADGLNKYDGYHFTVYHHDPDDSSTLASDDLTFVFEDSKERLWVGTRNNGLDLFDRANSYFKHIRLGKHSSLRSEAILGITEDRSGILWVRTDEDVDRLEITKKNASPWQDSIVIAHIKPDNIFLSTKKQHSSANVFADSRNHVYLITNTSVAEIVYNPMDGSYRLERRFKIQVIDSNFIPQMLEDNVNHCLLLNTKQIIKFPDYDFTDPQLLYTYTKDFMPYSMAWTIDKNQVLWLADSRSVHQISIRTGVKKIVTTTDPDKEKAMQLANFFYTDHKDVFWIGTAGFGLLKFDPQTAKFHHLMPGVPTYRIAEANNGLIITNNFKLLAIDTILPTGSNGLIDIPVLKKEFPNGSVTSFAKDSSGNLWIGADESRLLKYDQQTQKSTVYKLPFADSASMPFPVYADRHNKIWMGYNEFFVRYDPVSNMFSKFNYPLKSLSYDRSFLQCIYEDGNVLWLGSVNGVFSFDMNKQQMTHYYFYQYGDKHSISNNNIYSFCNDIKNPGRYLWIGTKGGGLNRLDKQTGKFARYTTKDGLSNNVVYGILPGNDGNLWVSTNKGISSFNPLLNFFRNYDVNDGLQGNEFNRYAYCKTENGLLVFGGMNGISYFSPETIKPLDAPDVQLTGFLLFNKPVNLTLPNSPLKRDIGYTQKITLEYSQNVATFQFAAMDYRKHGNINYRYRMEGFDKEWIYAGKAHEATYTNLDPGTYRFIVQASFENNTWGVRYTSLHVTIIPPWWKTWWFYLLAVSFTVAILYALYRFRIYQLTRLDRLRNRIARDLHDEVGSSISTISIYSKIVQQQIASKTFNNEPLVKKINDYAAEIMESMSDIVWNINTKNDAFEHIISRMREHAYQLFEAKEYLVYFEFDERLNKTKLNMEKRREFYLIYKEALNNIVKYANGKNASIILTENSAGIQLIIKDDGIGFDVNTIKKTGNGLSNMQVRAAALNGKLTISSRPGTGTELVLTF